MEHSISIANMWGVYRIPLLLIPVITGGQLLTNPVCGVEWFVYNINGLCTTANCPGECVDGGCCVNQCFDVTDDAIEMQTRCRNNDVQASCSGFEGEMQCVADLYNSTMDICRQQVLLLGSTNILTGDFNPTNCPCQNGYTKLTEYPPIITEVCKTEGLCYNVTDTSSDVTVLCINTSAVPEQATCAEDEHMDTSLPVTTFHTCESNCRGVCRDEQSDKLPVCCLPKTQNPRTPPATNEGSGELNVGYVILIVVVVIIFITFILFGVLYATRYRKLMNKPKQHTPGFSDLATKSSAV